MNIVKKVMRKRWGTQVKMNIDHDGTQAVVMVALDGWDWSKYENRAGHKVTWGNGVSGVTAGKNIRLSMNSPMRMTYQEWRALVDAVEEEWDYIMRGPGVLPAGDPK